jgi:hypothetical protein
MNVFGFVVCRYACNVGGEGIVLKTALKRTMRAPRRSSVTIVEILVIHFPIVLTLWKMEGPNLQVVSYARDKGT